ncbi:MULTISPECIES: hypothetical protein [Streptomyces]|uniref:Gram-positive cocci surface proteins LPxTG domain-containing protein n=1 Tax=Streptomyces viridochromogenes TaxID=1938 RepID=A0A0L8KR05_STRVR|nr:MULTISPECIES: hypothetical protein [Streptomyces]KOG28300.1 hypothetical protein ADK34_13820 [Streptomyces viridochromogenes]
MRTALRTAITTAALAGAVLAPAAGAFAATPAPAGTPTTAPAATSALTPVAPAAVAPATGTPKADGPATGTGTGTGTGTTEGSTGGTQDGQLGEQGPEETAGTSLGRRPLADGGYAELYRKSTGAYLADLHSPQGKLTGRLKADGGGAGDQFGSVFVILEADGAVKSWNNPLAGGDYNDVREGCTVTRYAAAPFQEVELALSNSPKGPVAKLIQDGKVIAVLDRGHDTALYGGARIKGLLDPAPAVPMLQMRVHGGPIPWDGVAFPAVPKNCATPSDTTPNTGTGTGTHQGATATPTAPAAQHATQTGTGAAAVAQTSVVPKGAVAAGPEPVAADHSLAFAGGAALAGAGAAGVALALFRRRGTAA